MSIKTQQNKRCGWVPVGDDLYTAYHDTEWGVPLHDDRRLFELLVLEGSQAGLSWRTVLAKRGNYRYAFNRFNPRIVARYTQANIRTLLGNPGIIRNRLKIEAAVSNAKVFCAIQRECGSFDRYLWNFVHNVPIQNSFVSFRTIPPRTALSETIAQDLKKRGMRFVGTTIIYAYMQSIGMVNDHETSCFRYHAVQKL